MRCDIHGCVEWTYDNREHWIPFCEVSLERNYRLFGALAGVRDITYQQFEPRGFPENAGWQARKSYSLYIVSDKELASEWNDVNVVVESRVSSFLQWGSVPVDKDHISNPDFHTPSWLTTQELKIACKAIPDYTEDADEMLAIVTMMERLELMGRQCRFIFWFDN